MAIFFFNFRQAGALIPDEAGSEFSNVEEAYLSAYHTALDMWRDLLSERIDPRCCSFEILDKGGNLLFVLPFIELLESCRTVQAEKPRSAREADFRSALKHHQQARSLCRELTDELRRARNNLVTSANLLAAIGKQE